MKTSTLRQKLFVLLLSFLGGSASAQVLLDPLTQPQFVNPLPIPSVVDATAGGLFTFTISQFGQNLGLIDPVTQKPLITQVWGYNGTYPGPTIVAKKDVAIHVFWINRLVDASGRPLPHLLPVDTSISWAFSGQADWQQYGVPIVTHLHGGHTESASDGGPGEWYTPNFTRKGPDFIKGDGIPYTYSNTQDAATLWYHDHAMGITRLNAYVGLAGFYIITDDYETALKSTGKLPAAPYDIGLAIQDKSFTKDGQLYYDSDPPEDTDPDPSVLPENFGDIIVVNGMAWSVLHVEPRQYRFRILNASDSRFYNLFLSSGQSFTQIAGDQGLLSAAVVMPDLLLAPGQRKEVIVDFSNPALQGQTIIMRNTSKVPFPRGSTVNPHTTGKIMAFRVDEPLNPSFAATHVPEILRPAIPRLTTTLPPRKLILFEGKDQYNRLQQRLGTFDSGALYYDHAITENPDLNSTEIWEIYNETVDAHPIHLHLVRMQLVNRQKFKAKVDSVTGKLSDVKLIGQSKGPSADEAGWNDTYIMYPGEVTRVIAHFDLPGKYVWHCHILSHEDHEMMRPFFVGPVNHQLISRKTEALPADQEEKLMVSTLPNPFTNNLYLQLTLEKPAIIEINLYNVDGSLVQRVYSGKRPAGQQQFIINGNRLINGTYLCEIQLNNKRVVRRIVLQK